MFGRYFSTVIFSVLLSQVPILGADLTTRQGEPATGEYLLYGKSMFDFSSGVNAYMSGGVPLAYGVNITFEPDGKVILDGLLGERNIYDPITGKYDAAARKMEFKTPKKELQNLSPYITLASSDESQTLLCALNPYGLGYVDLLETLSFSFSDDYRTLYPSSGFGAGQAYLVSQDLFQIGSYDVAIYDALLLKKEKGISFNIDSRYADVKNTYPGMTFTSTFRIYNTGDQRSEYVVGSSSPNFTIVNPSGILEPGDFVDIKVNFTAPQAGDYSGTLTITNEESDTAFDIKAKCVELPDYDKVVTAGKFEFSTDPVYPWTISEEYGDQPVAVCGNRGLEMTTSPLYAEIDITDKHAGHLSWTGYCDPYHPTRDAFGIKVDGEERYVSPTGGGSTSSTIEIAPGHHKVEFLYVKGPKVDGMFAAGEDYAWIKDIKLEEKALDEKAFSIDTDRIIFNPKTIVKKGANDSAEVYFKNDGWGDLQILGADSDNEAFSAEIPTQSIGTFETVPVKLLFHTFTPGKHNGRVTIHTNVGDAVIKCTGEAVTVPDFSAIVKQGDFDFDTSIMYPFMVEDNVAFNSTSKKTDRKATSSMLQANFEVPEGYIGELSWKARVSTSGSDGEDVTDAATIYIDGDDVARDYNGETLSDQFDFSPASVNFYPGSHFVCFAYTQNGDGKFQGDDRIEISELSLELKKMKEDEVRFWGADEVVFEDVRISKVYNREVKLANFGSHNLQIKSARYEGDFITDINTERLYNSLEEIPVEITFIPKTPGNHDGAMILDTTAGEVRIKCRVTVVDDPNTLLIEDFEDDWRFWDLVDGDQDGMTWANVMVPQNAFHGEHALQSFSIRSDFSESPIDDIAFSPEFTIPSGGATLEFYLACYYPAAADALQILAGTGTDINNYTSIKEMNLKGVEAYYNLYECSLDDFAGQTVRLAFRHALNKGVMSFVAIDDILVTGKGGSGISMIDNDSKEVKSIEYYNLQGLKVNHPSRGIYVKRTVYIDGSEAVEKVNITHQSIEQ